MSLSLLGALGVGAALSAVGGVVNNMISSHAVNQQISGNRDLFDYQWKKAYSPQAQVKNLTAAGLNPAAQFGNGSAVLNSAPSVGGVSQPQVFPIDGTQSLTDLAQYIAAGAQEKKTGADIGNIEADTELKKIEADRGRFQNDLLTRFGLQKSAADLALAEAQVRLANLSGDEKKQDIAIKRWTEAKEKASSEVNEAQRDILLKELANKDIELDIRNRQGEANIGEIKSRSALNYASAENQKTQADVNRENRRLQAALAYVEDTTKTDKINSLLAKYHADGELSDADYEEAKLRLSRLGDISDHRDNAWFSAVDNFTEWLKSKVKIFGK